MPFELPKLTYSYDALEPIIDAKTMEIHHTKHHATYTSKLNLALEKYPQYNNKSIVELLKDLEDLPEDIRTQVRNMGGGYYNHNLFWEVMAPGGSKLPQGELLDKITENFGNLETLTTKLIAEAIGKFGSGWAWLAFDEDKNLEILATPNQDSPWMLSLTPILNIDVWEHAYYLKYQNKRDEYVKNWIQLINWDVVLNKYLNPDA